MIMFVMAACTNLDSRVATVRPKKGSYMMVCILGYSDDVVGFWALRSQCFVGMLLSFEQFCADPPNPSLATLNTGHLLDKQFTAGASESLFRCSMLKLSLINQVL